MKRKGFILFILIQMNTPKLAAFTLHLTNGNTIEFGTEAGNYDLMI